MSRVAMVDLESWMNQIRGDDSQMMATTDEAVDSHVVIPQQGARGRGTIWCIHGATGRGATCTQTQRFQNCTMQRDDAACAHDQLG